MPPDDFMAFTADTGDSSGYSPSQKLDRNVVVDFWKNKPGVKPYVAEGVADAWNYESGLKPAAVNPTSGATGVPQYLGSRKAKLFSNENWQNPYAQFNQAWDEVNGGDAIATRHWDEIKNAKTREEAKALWEKYFERPRTTAKTGASAWNVAPAAISSEQARSNTDVRYMTPEEYLAMLPPLENDAAQKTKRRNLDDSLSSGDDIQSIPSLEVRPKGDSLTVTDYDGRNRAQAAIDAGVDEIPVAIRGVPKGSSFKYLVGTDNKKLPYSGFTRVPSVAPAQEARQITPVSFSQTPPEIAAVPQFNQQQQPAQPTVPISPPVPTKPDYYPEIAAGINKSIVNPASEAYRGVMPPNPATQATAANRIAAANANSAGQIGLPPAQPTSSLNSLLSTINPIGTAQAAEPSPGTNFTPFTPPPAASPGADFTPFTGDQGPSSGGIKQNIANALPLGALTVPAANMISGAVTAPIADINALLNPTQRGALGFPTAQGFNEARNRMIAATQLPMTPTQQLVANIASTPARAVTAVANWLLNAINPGLADTLAPLGNIAMDFAPALGLSPALRSAAMAPVRGALNALIQPTTMRAINAINKKYTKELATGGLPQQAFATELQRRRALGIPAVPADLVTRTGSAQPLNRMLSYATEAAPQGAKEVEQFSAQRAAGVPNAVAPSSRPTGGTLERLTQSTKTALGDKSARDINADLSKKINVASKAIKDSHETVRSKVTAPRSATKANLKQTQDALRAREAEVQRDVAHRQALNPQRILNPQRAIDRDRTVRALRRDERNLNSAMTRYDRIERQQEAIQKAKQAEIDTHTSNARALNTGQKIFQDTLRAEDIDKFMATATPAQKEHFRAGVSDIARDYYGRARELGKETDVFNKQNVKDKLRATFENQASADDFIQGIRYEKEVKDTWDKVKDDMKRAGRVSDSDMSRIHRLAESLAHYVWHVISPTHQVYSGSYWGLRALRNAMDVVRGGGGLAPRVVGDEILRAMYDPQAVISQRSRGLRGNKPMLLEPPARPATGPASVQRINNLTKTLTPAAYFSLRSQPEQSEPQQ